MNRTVQNEWICGRINRRDNSLLEGEHWGKVESLDVDPGQEYLYNDIFNMKFVLFTILVFLFVV